MSNPRNFQMFVICYGDIATRRSMVMAICMNEIADGASLFLRCECTKDWDKLSALFPDADIVFLREWCEVIGKEFCNPDTTQMAQEALKHCSTNIDVSVSTVSLDSTQDPATEMKRLLLLNSEL